MRTPVAHEKQVAVAATGGGSYPADRLGEPPNRPVIRNGKSVFLVHGFRVGADESRGWGSEFFKKLLRSGSRADFWMVTWNGDPSDGVDYYWAVNNAFLTASNLAATVNSVPGEKVVMAHSLGNMVVSSAIADHGMAASKYFALNAAVASEAFDASLFDTSTNNPLVHVEWYEHTNVCWSARWGEFFAFGDDRAKLTWRNRFAGVPMRTQMYNFHSSGDEVLEISPDGTPYILEIFWDGVRSLLGFDDADTRRNTWHKQEVYKGRNIVYGTGWAGWGFESNTTAAAANAAPPGVLRDLPIFEHDPAEMFASPIAPAMRDSILAKGIPALSEPMGIRQLAEVYAESVDMNDEKEIGRNAGWCRNHSVYKTRWLHSDIQNVAYFYTNCLFDRIVDKGGLK